MYQNHPLGTRRIVDRAFAIAFLVFVLVMLTIAIPTMARVPASTDIAPRPLPAPGPLAAADFPERAEIEGACIAILTKSSAVDNPRSQRAADLTSALLEDACFAA